MSMLFMNYNEQTEKIRFHLFKNKIKTKDEEEIACELTHSEAESLLEVIVHQYDEKSKELPDDYMAKIWFGKKIMRIHDFRMNINELKFYKNDPNPYETLAEVYAKLYELLEKAEYIVEKNKGHKIISEAALREMAENLGLLD